MRKKKATPECVCVRTQRNGEAVLLIRHPHRFFVWLCLDKLKPVEAYFAKYLAGRVELDGSVQIAAGGL